MKIVESDFTVITKDRNQMINITAQVETAVKETGINSGNVIVFCPHTTAAITINENADPDVVHDIMMTLDELLPYHREGYRHCEGNSDAHCKSSLIGCSRQIII
ncbi:MAG TPA: secondary thiamine-phosphate synthase enzyme YjbQ, partial [Sedimentisphaerales bacterium]|nr:secondary thiamine-phosphate synthase enzyme YjbQ [Sedimentisphaerales bacterium]